jgi:hypothetical protein
MRDRNHGAFGLQAVLATGCALLLTSSARGTVRTVGASGASNTTIAAAVTASVDGDTIRFIDPIITESNLTVGKSLTFEGLGMTNTILQATTYRGAGKNIFTLNVSGKTCTFRNMTMRHGNNANGAISVYYSTANVTTLVSNCFFTLNDGTATYGGGAIGNDGSNSLLLVNNCIFATNTSSTGGGAIWSRKGSCQVYNSTFLSNTNVGGSGGALNIELTYAGVTGIVANCTFVDNRAAKTSYGGAVYVTAVAGATQYVANCTIFSNSAGGGGGMWKEGAGALEVHSSIVATNLRSNASYSPEIQVQGGSLVLSNSLTLGQMTTNVTTYIYNTQTNTNPKLSALAFYGGPTPVMALQPDSPCTNRGSNVFGLPFDQRGPGFVRVIGAAADIGAYEVGAGPTTLVYSATVFNESAVNDGTIDNSAPIAMTLTNGTFAGTNGEDFVASGKAAVSNLPSGLTVVMARTSGTTLSVTIGGTAASHNAGDSVSNLTFVLQGTAFSGGDATLVNGAAATNLVVAFIGSVMNGQLSYSTNVLREATANDGSIDNTSPIVITLAYDTFTNVANGTDFVASNWVTVANVPPGLTAVVTKNDSLHVSATLAGNATLHNVADNVGNLTFVFQDAAFSRGNAASVTNYNKADLQVQFRNPGLSYGSTAFTEAWMNDGSIDNSAPMLITLAGDTLTGTNGQDFVATGKMTPANLPAGLSAVATRASATQLSVALNGSTTNHSTQVTNLTFTFASSAFAVTPAASVTNYSRADLQINFLPAPTNWYVATNGYDTNPGTASLPFATITNAVAHLSATACDTVSIGPGTFTEFDIQVTKNATFQGAGKTATIVQADPTPYNTAINHRLFYATANVIFRDLTLQNGNVTGDAAAIYCNQKVLILGNCRVRQNKAFASNSASPAGGAVYGHGLGPDYPGSMTLTGCDVQDNITIGNAGASGTPGTGAISCRNALSVSNCTFTGNVAPDGGGVFVDSNCRAALLVDSTFMSNVTTMTSSDSARGGGGARIPVGSVERCTFAWNIASNYGAGLWLGNATRAVQCTFYGNTSRGTTNSDGAGAGVYAKADNGGFIWLYNCTMTGNSTLAPANLNNGNGGGGGVYLRYGTLELISCIAASNTAALGGPDVHNYGAIAADHSLIGINTTTGIATGAPNAALCYVGEATNALNALLGPFANNGGKTWTCLPLAGSPAIDHGTNALGLAYDQRGPGYARAYRDSAIDIGATEFGSHLSAPGTALIFR